MLRSVLAASIVASATSIGVFSESAWMTNSSCSGPPDIEINWVTGGGCTPNHNADVSYGLAYNGTSCVSGGSLFTYVALDCSGDAVKVVTIPAIKFPEACLPSAGSSYKVQCTDTTTMYMDVDNTVGVPSATLGQALAHVAQSAQKITGH